MSKETQNYNWSFELDRINLYAYSDNFLSDEECEDIINIGKSKQLQKVLLAITTLTNQEIVISLG